MGDAEPQLVGHHDRFQTFLFATGVELEAKGLGQARGATAAALGPIGGKWHRGLLVGPRSRPEDQCRHMWATTQENDPRGAGPHPPRIEARCPMLVEDEDREMGGTGPARVPRVRMPGRTDSFTIDSAALAGNPLGDPARRTVPVWLPPSYDHAPARRSPVDYWLSGFASTGATFFQGCL